MAQQIREWTDKWDYMKLKSSAQQKKESVFEEPAHVIRVNLCHLYIKQGINHQSVQGVKNLK
jgi:hypothetical protein